MKIAERKLKEGLDDGRYAGIVDDINIDISLPFYQSIIKYAEDVVAEEIEVRMPKAGEIVLMAHDYVNHKSLKPANRGLIKDAIIIGMNMFRNRMKKDEV